MGTSFEHPELGAAAAGVGGDLCVAGLDGSSGDQGGGRSAGDTEQRIVRLSRGEQVFAGGLAHERLDLAVFEGVEGQHGEPTAGTQALEGALESLIQHAHLVIHDQPERLKNPGGRMGLAPAARAYFCHGVRQLLRCLESSHRPFPFNGPRDPASLRFVAQFPKHPGQLPRRPAVYHIRRRHRGPV